MEIEDVQDPKALTLQVCLYPPPQRPPPPTNSHPHKRTRTHTHTCTCIRKHKHTHTHAHTCTHTQGSQRRFRFRCENADLCRSWRVAIQEAKVRACVRVCMRVAQARCLLAGPQNLNFSVCFILSRSVPHLLTCNARCAHSWSARTPCIVGSGARRHTNWISDFLNKTRKIAFHTLTKTYLCACCSQCMYTDVHIRMYACPNWFLSDVDRLFGFLISDLSVSEKKQWAVVVSHTRIV